MTTRRSPTGHPAQLVRVARLVARLQTQKRKLARDLKRATSELRAETRNLRALMTEVEHQTRPDVIPSRVFGDGIGFARQVETPETRPVHPTTDEWVESLVASNDTPTKEKR